MPDAFFSPNNDGANAPRGGEAMQRFKKAASNDQEASKK
jgi:hypothetical protein